MGWRKHVLIVYDLLKCVYDTSATICQLLFFFVLLTPCREKGTSLFFLPRTYWK